MSSSISTSSESRKQPYLDLESLSRSWRAGTKPAPQVNVVEWAEAFRKLSKESSNGGKFITARVEVARGPMLAATEPGVRKLTLMACTQLLKTTVIENILGRFIHVDPCPILAVLPKDDAAETFSKDRLAPMIRDTKVLRELFGAAKATDAAATLTHKQFPGGHITLVGSNSPTNLAMRPIRLLVCDEIDKYPLSAGGEGPPIDLAEERQAEFITNSLTVLACSPTIAGRSAIEASYEESDQRRAFVQCPHCEGWHSLEWEQVRFEKDEAGKIRLETAHYHCAGCGTAWTESQRLVALRRIEWRQTRAFTCCGEHQVPERWAPEAHGVRRAVCRDCGSLAVPNEHAGFIGSKLYAPKQSIRETVAKYARAMRRGPEALRAFYNTQLARTWKEGVDAPEWQDVYARRDRAYLSGTIPLGALILFAGVDVQKDRLEVGIWAFGRNRERWLIEHRVLPGETNRPEVWKSLEAMFDETWEHAGGAEMGVRDWGIDSSGFTAEVYAFVRRQAGRGNVHAVDGQDSVQSAFLGVGAKDTTPAGKKLRRGLKTLRIGASFCKQELMGCLALQRPAQGEAFPAGFIHLPEDVSEDQVKQLTAEELVTHVTRGRTRRQWVPIGGRRNEVLDCANYARGVAAMRGRDRWRETQWRDLEHALGIARVRTVPEPDEPPPATVAPGSLAARNLHRATIRRSKVRSRTR
ncbi:phage terminase large subunit family protein [Methylobacterium gossipiicola]|uniref:Phage terminase, large subunit GpA n=1 Tax=Methylobacterium gossipiicola TaxID=582675 RepID=A0A1I2VZQ7_9HYPH|nr:terminase gpA endonuclease subunit [Methylobacterium gossipiicola]SFG92781.1 Phage terminase, large subunit GpA [Methylobacterium gossipiicola]